MGINKKFQQTLNSLPVSKEIKKELVLRINELVDDLKGGSDVPAQPNGIVVNSIFFAINGGNFQKIGPVIEEEDHFRCDIVIAESDISNVCICESDFTEFPENIEDNAILVATKGTGTVITLNNVIYKGTYKKRMLICNVASQA